MKTSENTENVMKALIQCQAQCQNVQKKKDGRFPHISVDQLLDAVRPKLAKCGLAITSEVGYLYIDHGVGKVKSTATLLHTSAEWLRYEMDIPLSNERSGQSIAQAVGSTISYIRKYQVAAILNISGTNETDFDSSSVAPQVEEKITISEKEVKDLRKKLSSVKISESDLLKKVTAKKLEDIDPINLPITYSLINKMIKGRDASQC